MARLLRPYIPLSVRVEVAERHVREMMTGPNQREAGTYWMFYTNSVPYMTMRRRLECLLMYLFPDGDFQLDHDPALSLRWYNSGSDRYYPDANNPAYLAYRAKDRHLQKTTGRRPGAERTVTSKDSDVWLKKKFDRLEGRTKRRPKQKIRSRGFQKGKRKINAAKKTRA